MLTKKEATPVQTRKTFTGFIQAIWKSKSATLSERTYYRNVLEKEYGSRYVTKTAMQEASGTLGGYLVPQQLALDLLKSLAEKSFIYPRALVVGMTTKELLLPTLDTQTTPVSGQSPFQGGMAFQWQETEGDTLDEDTPSFGQNVVTAWDLTGICPMSNQFLADAGPESEAALVELFARGASWQAEYSFLRGTGSANLMPLGMLNSQACVNVARAVANQIAAADIASMAAAMIPEGWRNAIWACSPSALAQIVKLSNYQLSQGPTGGEGGLAGFLVSRPLYITEKLPALGSTGDLMFFDPSMYVIGNRQEVVVDVDPHQLFQNNQTQFRVWLRIGGQPWLTKSVTLADGSTASSIVALQTL